jgi:hypothetical protein
MWALSQAFADNEAPVVPVGVAGDEASLLVVIPGPSQLPDRFPSLTAAGNISLKKATKTQISSLYRRLASGATLVTAKEAFAVAPGLGSTRIVTVRRSPDSGGQDVIEPLLAARITRAALESRAADDSDSWSALTRVADELAARTRGATQELQVLDLTAHPELQAVVDCIDVEM